MLKGSAAIPPESTKSGTIGGAESRFTLLHAHRVAEHLPQNDETMRAW